MSFARADLMQEIEESHAQLTRESGAAPKSWLVQSVMTKHLGIEGEDAPFAIYCAQEHVSASVDRYIREVKRREDEDETQTVIEGWEHLQSEYVVQRSGESVIVKVESLTYEEAMAKAGEHDSAAAGHFAHARELRRFAASKLRLQQAS